MSLHLGEDIAGIVMTLGQARGYDCFRGSEFALLVDALGRICRLHRVARPRVLAANPGVSARQTSNLFAPGKPEERSVAKNQVFTKLR
jgi:hypothetical protein